MAISKANPSATTTGSASEVIGKDISIFSLDYIVAIDGSAGPSGAQQAVLQAIQESRVILAAGPLSNSNTEQTFIIEGELDSGLQARIQALGTVDGVDLSGTTATVPSIIHCPRCIILLKIKKKHTPVCFFFGSKKVDMYHKTCII